MKKQSFLLGAALMSAALALASCNQADPAAGADPLSGLSVSAFRNAVITTEGASVTATRSGAGNQGIVLRRGAVLVNFTVEGENARIRIVRGPQMMSVRPAATNAVMIGPGGATAVTVFSNTGDAVKINVTSVVDCATAPEGACQPPQFPAEAEASDEADAPAPASAPAAAPPATP